MTKARIEAVLKEAYDKFKDVKEGENADYIKELATVDPIYWVLPEMDGILPFRRSSFPLNIISHKHFIKTKVIALK